MRVFDSDGHVTEGPDVFSDRYLDPAFRSRRPQVVGADGQAYWLIDTQIFPRLRGRGSHFSGTPVRVGDQQTPLSHGKPESVASQEIQTAAARIVDLDAEAIDAQVIYPSLFLTQPLSSDPALNTALSRSYNNWAADVCGASNRLRWVAVVALDDPAGAAAEVRRAGSELGAVGVMILGTAGDVMLDDPSLLPFWEAAATADLPVGVHVGWSCPALKNLYDTPLFTGSISFTMPVLMGFAAILGGGILDRFPNLRVGFFEAGCQWLHFMTERLDHYYAFGHKAAEVFDLAPPAGRLTPIEYVRSGRVFINVEADDKLLPQVVELIGEDQLLFASDMPHGDREPMVAKAIERREDIAEPTKRKLLWDNTLRFYGLSERDVGRRS